VRHNGPSRRPSEQRDELAAAAQAFLSDSSLSEFVQCIPGLAVHPADAAVAQERPRPVDIECSADEETEMPRAQTSNPSMTDVWLLLAMTMEFLHRFLSAPGN
jgi:hypothetical protein